MLKRVRMMKDNKVIICIISSSFFPEINSFRLLLYVGLILLKLTITHYNIPSNVTKNILIVRFCYIFLFENMKYPNY